MIPPLLLDVQSHHRVLILFLKKKINFRNFSQHSSRFISQVLDMCAAPGSKTSQLIEYLHTGCGDKVPGKCFFYLTTFFLLLFIQLPFSLAEGIVIANDDSHDRCYTLIHQTKRLRSPSTLIVNHDASLFPTILLEKEGVSVPMQFDRILADVPCSGDGTMRKNPGVWQKWSVTQAAALNGFAATQLFC